MQEKIELDDPGAVPRQSSNGLNDYWIYTVEASLGFDYKCCCFTGIFKEAVYETISLFLIHPCMQRHLVHELQ